MDNITRFYISEYDEAYELAATGDIDRALEVCYSLRLRADLSLYLRAALKVLLGVIAKLDNQRYYREALELIDEIREENGRGKLFPELDRLERDARDGLEALSGDGCHDIGSTGAAGGIEGMYREDNAEDLSADETFETQGSFSSTHRQSQPFSNFSESFEGLSEQTSIAPNSSPPQRK